VLRDRLIPAGVPSEEALVNRRRRTRRKPTVVGELAGDPERRQHDDPRG
jgi:hypothetical protein